VFVTSARATRFAFARSVPERAGGGWYVRRSQDQKRRKPICTPRPALLAASCFVGEVQGSFIHRYSRDSNNAGRASRFPR
jgi:hypothetical protein